MIDTPTLNPNTCARCGAHLALVGRSHRCVPNSVPNADKGDPVPNDVPNNATPLRVLQWKADNADHYRAYMRELMRKRRAKASV